MNRHASRRTWSSVLTALAVVTSGLTLLLAAAPAAQAEDPPAPLPSTVTADALPTAQIDGVVWKQVIVGNTVYVGGQFTNARPAGSAMGTNTVPRNNMLAYDIRTGVMTSFAPNLNGRVADMAATPDGSKLVVVGTFTTVDGQTRNRAAVFNLPSGTLNTSVVPNLNGVTSAVAASNSAFYFGGYFSAINNVARTRTGAVSTTNGALLPFNAPVDNGQVHSMVVAPDGDSLVLSGSFTTVGGSGEPGYGLARVSSATGTPMALPVNSVVRNAGDSAGVLRLASDSTSFYGVGWHYGSGGNSEGTFQASWSNGELVNLEDCHGDTYDVAPIGEVVYVASHKHHCQNSGAFPQSAPDWTMWHSTAWTKSAQGTNAQDTYGYPDSPGTPRPALLPWLPQWSVGTYTGQGQATWAVTGNSQYVLWGGEFTGVNGVAQQGIARFAVRSIAPNKSGPRTHEGTGFSPSVRSDVAGQARVSWPALWDRDDDTLTYQVYRDNTSTKVFETTRTGPWWLSPDLTFVDTGLTPGSTPRYAVRILDPSGNLVNSNWTTVTVADASSLNTYSQHVLNDGATKFWRLNESGSDVADWAGPDNTTAGAGVTRGAPGAMTTSDDAASTFNGSDSGVVVSGDDMLLAPNTFTTEVWFKTTSLTGGKIAGFGDRNSARSGHYDRHLYMNAAGSVLFGVAPDGVRATLQSPAALNDGEWHQAVGTLGANGLRLYIDGQEVAARADVTAGEAYGGFWRVGGDSSWAGTTARWFNGSIDDFSVYATALTATQVSNHWAASGRGNVPDPPDTTQPNAAFSTSAVGRKLSLRGTGTPSSGASITSYGWRFGDGASAAGASASHTYARAGTYTVTFTVTDSAGKSKAVAKRLAVVNARPIASLGVSKNKRVVTLNAAGSRDPDGRVSSYFWRFGDGTRAWGATVRHRYAKFKKYTVTLVITDNSGTKVSVVRKVRTRRGG